MSKETSSQFAAVSSGALWGAVVAFAAMFGLRGCDSPETGLPAVVTLNESTLLLHSPDGRPIRLLLAGENEARISRSVEVSVSEPPPGPDPVIVVPPVPRPPEPPPPPVVTPPVVTPPVTPPVVPPVVVKPTAATYVYEKSLHPLPKGVLSALTKLNVERPTGFVGSVFEQNTRTGTGTVPAQYKLAVETAIAAGLPALVVQSGGTVLKVVKNPLTEAQVLEAVGTLK